MLVEQIRKSMRIKHDKLDDLIASDIDTCLCDLAQKGIKKELLKSDTEDKLIQKSCEFYVKWQTDYTGKGEQFKNAYESLRDSLCLDCDYREESVADV